MLACPREDAVTACAWRAFQLLFINSGHGRSKLASPTCPVFMGVWVLASLLERIDLVQTNGGLLDLNGVLISAQAGRGLELKGCTSNDSMMKYRIRSTQKRPGEL